MTASRPTALVTGASTGIGYELCKLFAADGYDVVLVSRDGQKLEAVAAELEQDRSIRATVVPADLSLPEAPAAVFDAVGDRRIDVLVNNAGYTTCGPFADSDLQDELGLVQVNVMSLMQLTRLFLAPMVERKVGRIWNLSSVAAFTPGPFQASYYASKAFVQSFTEALHAELKGSGITATAICPGPTRSEFQKRAGMRPAHTLGEAMIMDAAQVARIAYDAGMRGQRKIVTGAVNKLLAFGAQRLLPRAMSLGILTRVNKDRKLDQ